jgi:hypothetical protein
MTMAYVYRHIRLKISGYNASWVGAEQYVYLTRVN